MLEYMDKKQYKKAMEIADTIDWRRVKNVSMLNMVSEIYEYNGEFQKSRDILFVAFDRAPGSRKIVYRLGNLALKIEDFEEASDCYEEFVKLAPKDPNQYILKYKILRAQGAPLEEQIHALEDFKKAEYVEKWAYELAKLYHEAGMTAECLEECDDLILWFSEGKYVYQAMELKMKYKPLTPLQKEKYDARPGAPKKEESEKTEEKKPEQAKTPMAEIIREAEAAEEEKVQDVARELKQNGIDVAEELPEVVEEEIPEKHSAITRVVKGATLQEALATGVAIASGINIEEKAMKEKDEALRVTGQMRIEEILQEWEAKQKANAEVIEKKKQEDRERIRKEREAAERRKEAERLEVEKRAAEAARKAAEEEAARKAAEEAARKAAEEEAARKAAEEAARKAAEEEAARKAAEEAARKAAEEEAARKAAEEAARKAAEEEAARKAAEEAARKAAEEEAARKAAEEAARKAAEEEAARKAAEEAARKAAEEEAARKAAEEAARKAAEEEAARKAAEEAARKAAEEEAARKAAEEEAARKAAEEEAAKKAAEEADTIIQGKTQRIPDDIVKLMEEMENDVEEDNFEADALEDTFETEEVEDQEEDFDIEDFIGDFEEDFAEEFEEDFEEEDFEEEDFGEEDFGEEDFGEEDFEEEDFGEEDFGEEDFEEEDFEEEDFGEEDFEEEDFEEADFEEELEEEDFAEEDFEEEELEKAEPEPITETLEIEEPSEEEIQKRIKKSKGGGVPFDTGFVVTGRYDLSATSEIGLKAGLTEEQKKLFSYFVPVRGMSEQIVEVLDNDRRAQREGTSKTGNLLVIGRKGSGKTVLAVDIVKAIQKQRNLKQGKVAIVTGESLNKKELTNIIQKLRGGAIIIEKAGKLNSRTIKELNYLMEKKTGELLFVLEDQRKPLERLMTANPDFKKKFTSRLELPVFINDELVTFGQTYAKENGYKLDEMGILALYSRIDVMQREDHAVSVAEVKEIMDEAIEHSQKANVKHLARRVFGRSTDESDRIILKEEDFKI
ncbi:hypothetical protein [Blautia obeum]|uniref:hypothetical protein n=1 Tax=Blautia obeum TaxID=40520 RepID=UPI003D01F2B6